MSYIDILNPYFNKKVIVTIDSRAVEGILHSFDHMTKKLKIINGQGMREVAKVSNEQKEEALKNPAYFELISITNIKRFEVCVFD